MANVVSSLVALALMLTAIVAVVHSVFDSNQKTALAFVDSGENIAEQSRAGVVATSASATSDSSSTSVDVTVANTGKVPYGDLSAWHVTAEYQDASEQLLITKLDYSESEVTNAWTLQGIYLDASVPTDEYASLNVLNEGEEMVLRLKLNPAANTGSTGRVVLVPPVGGPTSIFFNG